MFYKYYYKYKFLKMLQKIKNVEYKLFEFNKIYIRKK